MTRWEITVGCKILTECFLFPLSFGKFELSLTLRRGRCKSDGRKLTVQPSILNRESVRMSRLHVGQLSEEPPSRSAAGRVNECLAGPAQSQSKANPCIYS